MTSIEVSKYFGASKTIFDSEMQLRLEYLCKDVPELKKELSEEDEREDLQENYDDENDGVGKVQVDYENETGVNVDLPMNSMIALPEDICIPGAKGVDLQDNYDDEIKEHLKIQYERVYDEVCEKQVKDDYGAPDAPVIDTYGSPADSMIAVTEVCSTEYQSECQTVREEHNVEDSVVESKEEIESNCEDVTSCHTSSQKCDVQKKKGKNTLLNKVVEINYQVLKTEDSFDLREGVLSVQEKHACQHGHRVQCGEGVVDQQDHHRCQRVWDPGIRYFCMKY